MVSFSQNAKWFTGERGRELLKNRDDIFWSKKIEMIFTHTSFFFGEGTPLIYSRFFVYRYKNNRFWSNNNLMQYVVLIKFSIWLGIQAQFCFLHPKSHILFPSHFICFFYQYILFGLKLLWATLFGYIPNRHINSLNWWMLNHSSTI